MPEMKELEVFLIQLLQTLWAYSVCKGKWYHNEERNGRFFKKIQIKILDIKYMIIPERKNILDGINSKLHNTEEKSNMKTEEYKQLKMSQGEKN